MIRGMCIVDRHIAAGGGVVVVVNLLETTTVPWTALDVVRVSTRAMIRYL